MEPLIFPYDHQIWERQRLNQWLVLLFFPLLSFSCLFLTPFFFWLEIRVVVGIAAAVFLLAALGLIWFQHTFFRPRRDTKLLLDDKAITHVNEAVLRGLSYAAVRISYDEIISQFYSILCRMVRVWRWGWMMWEWYFRQSDYLPGC